MLCVRKVQRYGGSLGIGLPDHAVELLGIAKGDLVAVGVIGDQIVVRKLETAGLLRPGELQFPRPGFVQRR